MYVALAERHGHYCPMSTLGLRLGWAAFKRLKGELQGATYLAKTCARDGISLALSFENLQYEEQDQHRLCFSDQDNHWEITLLPQTLKLAASYRLLPSDAERDALLEGFRNADEAQLMEIVQSGDVI